MATAGHQQPIESLFASPRAIDLGEQTALARRVGQLLESLQQEFLLPDSSAAPVGTWLACSVLWMLAAGTSTHASTAAHEAITPPAAPEQRGHRDAKRLGRFRQLIERQYLDHWPVARYARHLALSETSLNRLCRAMTGTTAFELIQLRLALEARRRLIYSLNSVSRVAAELGFQDPAYFSRFFRRRNGLGPNEYRRRHHGG
jgi:AraC family transcriptional activator of pobA